MDATSTPPPHFDLTGQVAIQGYMPEFTGNYSCVYRGVVNGNLVAVKIIKATGKPETMKRKVMRERAIWASLNHPNIHPFYGFADNADFGPFGALVSPWSAKGDASRHLNENGEHMMIAERLKLWKGVIEGVIYLHDQTPPIVHGDLKPGNILIDYLGIPTICDFGLARIFIEEGSTGLTTTSEHTGTVRYLAPELVASDVTVYPTLASDVYALGCLGLEFIFLQQPFANHVNNLRGQIFRDLRRGLPPAAERPQQVWPSIRAWPILGTCWNSDPEFRPSAFSAARMVRRTVFTCPAVVVQRIIHSVDMEFDGETQERWIYWPQRCSTLRNLCLVSRAYRNYTVPFLYREIRMNLNEQTKRLSVLLSALGSVAINLQLSPEEPDGDGTRTKSLCLFIANSTLRQFHMSAGIRNLVDRLPGLRLISLSTYPFPPLAANVSPLTTLHLYGVDVAGFFDSRPTLHILESIQRLLMDGCTASTSYTDPLTGPVPKLYLPNLLEISLGEDWETYTADPFPLLFTWTMPRLRSLEFSTGFASSGAITGCLAFLRIHGFQLQHLTLKHPNLSERTSDLLELCSSLRSFDIGDLSYDFPFFRLHPHLEKVKANFVSPSPWDSKMARLLGEISSLMRTARTSFPNLVEAEISRNIFYAVGAQETKASFHAGDKFITCWGRNKAYRMYDGQDTLVDVTENSDMRG